MVDPGTSLCVDLASRSDDSLSGAFDLDLRLVDPNLPGKRRRLRIAVREPFRMGGVRLRQHGGAPGEPPARVRSARRAASAAQVRCGGARCCTRGRSRRSELGRLG